MIIICNNCNKNFEADSSLIPEKGRLVQCNSCDHKWFFKKIIANKSAPIVKIKDLIEEQEPLKKVMAVFEDKIVPAEKEFPKIIELLDEVNDEISVIEKNSDKEKTKKNEVKDDNKEINITTSKNKKSYNIFGLIVVFIISFIAIIIVFDTFQSPIGKIVPNFEFVLYNLYETINDIKLFLIDLF
tara:strand:- start:120 stop:674 length:555 start_codon:yes stop_codon:yes gene_type:complete